MRRPFLLDPGRGVRESRDAQSLPDTRQPPTIVEGGTPRQGPPLPRVPLRRPYRPRVGTFSFFVSRVDTVVLLHLIRTCLPGPVPSPGPSWWVSESPRGPFPGLDLCPPPPQRGLVCHHPRPRTSDPSTPVGGQVGSLLSSDLLLRNFYVSVLKGSNFYLSSSSFPSVEVVLPPRVP